MWRQDWTIIPTHCSTCSQRELNARRSLHETLGLSGWGQVGAKEAGEEGMPWYKRGWQSWV